MRISRRPITTTNLLKQLRHSRIRILISRHSHNRGRTHPIPRRQRRPRGLIPDTHPPVIHHTQRTKLRRSINTTPQRHPLLGTLRPRSSTLRRRIHKIDRPKTPNLRRQALKKVRTLLAGRLWSINNRQSHRSLSIRQRQMTPHPDNTSDQTHSQHQRYDRTVDHHTRRRIHGRHTSVKPL